MTNFDKIKNELSNIDIESFIKYCGGDHNGNILCQEIHGDDMLCRGKAGSSCAECIRTYLNKELY